MLCARGIFMQLLAYQAGFIASDLGSWFQGADVVNNRFLHLRRVLKILIEDVVKVKCRGRLAKQISGFAFRSFSNRRMQLILQVL